MTTLATTQPEDMEKKLTDKEIFTKIWTSPRTVFRYLNEKNYDAYVPVLLIVGGILRTLDRASAKGLGDKMSLPGVLATCIIGGALFGWLYFYIYAAALSFTGKWLGGEAKFKSTLRTLAYALIPSTCMIVMWTIQIILYGNGMFQNEFDIETGGTVRLILFFISFIASVILSIWSFILLIVGLSEVQKFSIGKAILNIFLPVVVLLAAVAILVLLFRS